MQIVYDTYKCVIFPEGTLHNIKKEVNFESTASDLSIMDALDGFIFVLCQEGQCLYVSPNVAQYLGISQVYMNLYI